MSQIELRFRTVLCAVAWKLKKKPKNIPITQHWDLNLVSTQKQTKNSIDLTNENEMCISTLNVDTKMSTGPENI